MSKLVRLQSTIPFVGQSILVDHSKEELKRRLACFTTPDGQVSLLRRETIYRNGERVGWTTSAGWGYTIDKNIAYGYVRNSEGVSDSFLYDGEYELEVEEVRIPVQIEHQAPYDPKSIRMRS